MRVVRTHHVDGVPRAGSDKGLYRVGKSLRPLAGGRHALSLPERAYVRLYQFSSTVFLTSHLVHPLLELRITREVSTTTPAHRPEQHQSPGYEQQYAPEGVRYDLKSKASSNNKSPATSKTMPHTTPDSRCCIVATPPFRPQGANPFHRHHDAIDSKSAHSENTLVLGSSKMSPPLRCRDH